MRRNLPLSVLTVAVLSGCTSIDLKPVSKPVNPRVIERDLAPPKPAVQSVPVRPAAAPAPVSQVDETADLPVMPLKSPAPDSSKGGAGAADQSGKARTAAAGKPLVVAVPGGAAKAAAAVPAVAAAKSGSGEQDKAAKGQVWHIKASDVRLASTFERWAKESTDSGVPFSILWDAGKHVLIEAPTEYRGSFLDAIEQALKSPSILQSDYPLEACEYPNTPPVVRITRWGEQAKDCPEYR